MTVIILYVWSNHHLFFTRILDGTSDCFAVLAVGTEQLT